MTSQGSKAAFPNDFRDIDLNNSIDELMEETGKLTAAGVPSNFESTKATKRSHTEASAPSERAGLTYVPTRGNYEKVLEQLPMVVQCSVSAYQEHERSAVLNAYLNERVSGLQDFEQQFVLEATNALEMFSRLKGVLTKTIIAR